eukprot:TRINITY_DN10162_c0_g1_i1.p1 TRINITY_DN10162_c0_g1~~TRINITY_DN10162_c0_g1_i1.p1  ORF type:complete len:424 (+),score=76.36 TRINITY_DN10162_c0_g1_i1:157-1428(+)
MAPEAAVAPSCPARTQELENDFAAAVPAASAACAGISVAGLRYVAPYDYVVRQRLGEFAGQRLSEVLRQAPGLAGGDMEAEWWAVELEAGRIRLERTAGRHGTDDSACEDDAVSADHVIGASDRFRLRVHVHERVLAEAPPPKVIYADDHFVVSCKPAGVDIFTNASGGCVATSLMGALSAMGYDNLTPAHRIDKPVSGLVCFARHPKAASRMVRCIQRHAAQKTYLARVAAAKGPPPEGLVINAPLLVLEASRTSKVRTVVDVERGKPSRTEIAQVLAHYRDGTALVAISISTGRMHQIRCHLQHAGYPIANDAVYGGRADETQQLYQDNEAGDLRSMLESTYRRGCRACSFYRNVLDGACRAPRLEPTIFLHSWKYAFPTLNLSFEAPLPTWAEGDFDVRAGLSASFDLSARADKMLFQNM